MTAWRRGALVVCAGLTACLTPRGAGGLRTPGDYVDATRTALREGKVDLAEDIVSRARQRYPLHGGVLLWQARLAELRWQDELAALDLKGVCRSEKHGGLELAEARGRAGEVLFRLGRYAEARGFLEEGLVGPATARRRALAALSRELPPLRREGPDAETRIALARTGLPEVMVVSGGITVPFVMDTGASFTAISRSRADDLRVTHVTDGGEAIDGAGLTFPIAFGILPVLPLGDLVLELLPVLVVDDRLLALQDHFGGPERPATCLLGLDVVTRYRVAVDPGQGHLELSPSVGLPRARSIPCLQLDGSLRVPVAVEGRAMWFILDTGASHSSLTEAGVNELPGGGRRAAVGYRRVRTPGGSQFSVRELRNLAVEVSEARFTGVNLPVVNRPGAAGFPVHGVLGADLFLRCRSTIDRGRLRMEVR